MTAQPFLSLQPTPSQTFRIVGRGERGNLAKLLDHSYALQAEGDIEAACNVRFEAFQAILEAVESEEEVELDRTHPNTLAAMEIIQASAIDHYLIGDPTMASAQLEMLLDLDSEDPLEVSPQLALCYVMLDDGECLDDILPDLDDRTPIRAIVECCRTFARSKQLDPKWLAALRHHKEVADEIVADRHTTDEAYLADITSERPSRTALARELYLRCYPALTHIDGLIPALRAALGR